MEAKKNKVFTILVIDKTECETNYDVYVCDTEEIACQKAQELIKNYKDYLFENDDIDINDEENGWVEDDCLPKYYNLFAEWSVDSFCLTITEQTIIE